MRPVTKVYLTEETKAALESGYRHGGSHVFRTRCHVILLKHEGRNSKDIGLITDMWDVSVNHWVRRYKADGLQGLTTKAGQGRKPILDFEKDMASVCNAVKSERQRLSQAKEILVAELHKEFSDRTLKRFLKKLSADING